MSAQITGRDYLRLLQDHLEYLNKLYPHPNRVLFYDDVVTVYLIAFFNPAITSLRQIEHASQIKGINRFLNVDAVCKSTLSDVNALFDPAHLQGLIQQLRKRLPGLQQQDPKLADLLKQVMIHDGSFFRVAGDVAWAMGSANQHGRAGRQVRLNCQFCLDSGVPVQVSINGGDGVGEGTAAGAMIEPNQIYLFDSGVVSFDLLEKILAGSSQFLCNLRAGVNFTAAQTRPLSQADIAAGVISDCVGKLSGSDRRTPPEALLREIIIQYTSRSGETKTLRLLTSLLQLPAASIGELYRYRWQIELFFRWLKVHASFEHLTSHSRNGITLGFYVAVIACLLICLRSGRPLSKYAYSMLSLVAMGMGNVEEILPILQNQERQSQRERERIAAKRAAKNKA